MRNHTKIRPLSSQINAKITGKKRKKVHASFCTKMGSVPMLEVEHALRSANCEHTTHHDNRRFTAENWWEEWSTKAGEADNLLVFFVPEV